MLLFNLLGDLALSHCLQQRLDVLPTRRWHAAAGYDRAHGNTWFMWNLKGETASNIHRLWFPWARITPAIVFVSRNAVRQLSSRIIHLAAVISIWSSHFFLLHFEISAWNQCWLQTSPQVLYDVDPLGLRKEFRSLLQRAIAGIWLHLKAMIF